MTVLAIVGTREFKIPHAFLYARHIMEYHIKQLDPDKDLVISGGAEGIDSIAIDVAQNLGYHWEEFLPENNVWAPNGYKERNEKIAETCDILVSIRCRYAATYGSGWTRDRAVDLGKIVHPYIL